LKTFNVQFVSTGDRILLAIFTNLGRISSIPEAE